MQRREREQEKTLVHVFGFFGGGLLAIMSDVSEYFRTKEILLVGFISKGFHFQMLGLKILTITVKDGVEKLCQRNAQLRTNLSPKQ